MKKYQKVAQLVKQAYENSEQSFAQWTWKNHVPIVAKKTEELSERFDADADKAVAGAWLHDYGDVFVHRHSDNHEEISVTEATKVLQQAEYSSEDIEEIIEVIVEPHSCRDGNLPTTLEGKVLATSDSLAHLTTDFYVQVCWMHIPEGKDYPQFIEWVTKKLDRDFNKKIFFEEIQSEVKHRYDALVEVFVNKRDNI